MGDRGNIVVRASNSNRDDVWFYTHWSGSNIKATAKKALKRGESRWSDSPYLARIVFDDLTDGNKDTTGFGISTAITDNEYPIVVIDTPNQRVFEILETHLKGGRIPEDYKPETFKSFADYVK